MSAARQFETRTVSRVDRFRLDFARGRPVKVSGGMVEFWGVATRVGVFDYDDEVEPGKIFRELRPREEVMDAASLATLRGVPFTLDHPTDDVTIDNYRELNHGTVLDVVPEGDLVWVKIRASSADALRMIDSGVVELSGGYTARLEDRSGITHDGQRFDAVQREIRYNHLALVDVARAGPVARLKLDGTAANHRVYRRDQRKRTPMKTIKIKRDGKTHTIPAIEIKYDGKTRTIPSFWAPGLVSMSNATAARTDQFETSAVTFELDGETIELVLPKATVEAMLAVAGAAAQVEDPAGSEGAPDEPITESVDGEHEEDEPGAGPGGDPGNAREEEEDAMLRGRFDKAAIAKIEKMVDRRVAKALNSDRKDSRQRASIERQACRILDAGYDYAEASSWEICADVVAIVDKTHGDAAKAHADKATKGDAIAQGRLLSRFEDAVKAHRDAQDKTGETVEEIANRSDAARESDAKDEETGSAGAAKRMRDRLYNRTPAKTPDKAATA